MPKAKEPNRQQGPVKYNVGWRKVVRNFSPSYVILKRHFHTPLTMVTDGLPSRWELELSRYYLGLSHFPRQLFIICPSHSLH